MWSGAILAFISILFMAAWGRAIQHYAEKFFGKQILISITLVFILAGAWMFYHTVFRIREQRLKRLVLFCIIASVYIWRLATLHVQVERFHLIEYGLLAVLVSLGALHRNQGIAALGWGLAAAWLGGLCDEFFQWWLPARVGEWRDVVINIQSGVLGLAALSLVYHHRLKPIKPSGKHVLYLMIVFSILSVLSGQFILKVHVFGIENTDAEIGVFNSLFSPETLLNAELNTYLNAVNDAGGHQHDNYITDYFLYFYEREAREHFDRTHLLTELNHLDEARSELLLTEKYFNIWMTANEKEFTDPVREALKTQAPMAPEQFTSRVMDWYWIGSSRKQVLWCSLLVALLFPLAAVIYWRIVL